MADIQEATCHASRTREARRADCRDCTKLHPDSTRERCRVHVELTGHTVLFSVADVTIYQPGEVPNGVQ